MAVDFDLLTDIPSLANLLPETLGQMARHSCLLSIPSGESLYQQGDPPSGLYILVSGRVKLFRQSQDKMQILCVLVAGMCFGAESLSTGEMNPYSATTISAAELVYLSPDSLLELLGFSPDLRVFMLELVTRRLREFAMLIHNLAFRDVPSRLAAVLVSWSDAEGQMAEDGIRIKRFLSQQDMASVVGTAREVLYRTLKKFEQDEIILLTKKHIIICNKQKLTQIAHRESR
ncbi:MAG: Crp/Fnr family transcriptional regulator [Anaerolineaceae bacterium]|nr:Crp/Fnr family transcriptional regulator [Anaerolineaceae bacterium]